MQSLLDEIIVVLKQKGWTCPRLVAYMRDKVKETLEKISVSNMPIHKRFVFKHPLRQDYKFVQLSELSQSAQDIILMHNAKSIAIMS